MKVKFRRETQYPANSNPCGKFYSFLGFFCIFKEAKHHQNNWKLIQYCALCVFFSLTQLPGHPGV